MTVNTIIVKARRILQDATAPFRWPNEEMKDAIKDGILALNSVRPETRYVGGLLVDSVDLPNEDDAPIAIEDRFEEALSFYVVYKCLLNDSSDTTNQQLADSYLGKFSQRAQL